jgi:hypothetical protein
MDSHRLYELLHKNFLVTTREHELSKEQVHNIDGLLEDIGKYIRDTAPVQESSRRVRIMQERIYDLEELVDRLREEAVDLREELQAERRKKHQ